MSNRHGGRRIKINFDSNENGEICFKVESLAYPHSYRGGTKCGAWLLWEQKCFHRPAQAFKELFFALRDLELIDNASGVEAAAEYWAKDMDETRVERVHNIREYKGFLSANAQ